MWVQSDIDSLKAAIAQGVLRVRYSGPPEREVTYQSIPDMLRVLALAQQYVASQAGTPLFKFAGTSKGI